MKRYLLVLAIMLAALLPAKAQVPVQISPVPYSTFFNADGAPLAGGQLFTYAAGTSTPQATYTDSTGLVEQSNPIIMDVAGRASIWMSSLSYKFVLMDAFGVIQWTQDNVSVGIFANANNTFTGNNTFIGTNTFTGPFIVTNGGTLNGSFAGNPNFSGNPTFSGSPSFAGVSTLLLNSITSLTGTPATIGFLRMASGDQLCWRNTLNTLNICISKDASDTFLLGTTPIALIKPPVTVAFSTTPVFDASLGTVFDLTLTGNVASSTLINAVNGQTYSFIIHQNSTGGWTFVWPVTVPGTAITLTASATTVQIFVVDASGIVQPDVIFPIPLQVVQANSQTLLGSITTLANSSLTTLITKSVTMPTTGGPWRVVASYNLNLSISNHTNYWINSYVTDGTVKFAGSTQGNSSGLNSFLTGQNGSEMSSVSYANSAVVSFVLKTEAQVDGGGSATVNILPPGVSAGPSSTLTLSVVSSN